MDRTYLLGCHFTLDHFIRHLVAMSGKPPAHTTTDDSGFEPHDHLELHEGGTRAWLTVVGSALVYFASFGFMNSFGYFQDFYQNDYYPRYTASTIAFIGTLQISLMYIVGPVAGALFDSYGIKVSLLLKTQGRNPDQKQWMYPLAALGCCGSLVGLSFSQPGAIWQPFLSQVIKSIYDT
jgi:hypothetical protein